MEQKLLFIYPRRRLAKLMGISPTNVWDQIQKLRKQGKLVSWYSKGRPNYYVKKL